MDPIDIHQRHAEAVRSAVVGPNGRLDPALRRAAMARAAGGAPIAEPFDALAHQVGEAASRVTDAQVAAVRSTTGSDMGAFEVVMAACVGAGLARWDAAVRAIDEADDATS